MLRFAIVFFRDDTDFAVIYAHAASVADYAIPS